MRRFRHFTKAALLALVTAISALVVPAGAQANPTNTSPPGIVGTPQQGQTLTEVEGNWEGSPPLSSPQVQWEDCTDSRATSCRDIPSAPSTADSSYTLGPGDVGSFIVVIETVTDRNGATSASSSPSAS